MMRRAPLKRTGPIKRTRMRRRFKSTKYSRRERNTDFMLFVKGQLCSVEEEWPLGIQPTACSGEIEADHDSRGRGLGQKSDDSTCIPLCSLHHTERTDHTGTFKHMKRDQIREWFDRAQLRISVLWKEHNGEDLT